VFIADINREQASVFRPAITQALQDYYPVKQKIIEARRKEIEAREAIQFTIKDEYSYNDNFATLSSSESTSELSVVQPFYIRSKYKGRENEVKFIRFLEQKADSLEWWFKNGEGSKEYYCLKYKNTKTNEDALFYPDWILKFKDGRVGIFDTKSGFTAQDPEGRAEGLAEKLEQLNKESQNFIGGLVVLENNQWYFFDADAGIDYEYSPGRMNDGWKLFDELF
jgi:type III restriction enzyme